MKLAFTTLGCPSWDLATILQKAGEFGFDAVDFRGYRGDMDIYRLPEFARDREATARRIRDAGLALNCFSSGACLMPTAGKPVEESIAEVRAYAELCPVFGTPYIRVFGQGIGDMTREEAVEEASATLGRMARLAGDHGASVLLETHDSWVKSEHVRALMERVDSPQAGVVWDVHHPWRAAGESAAETWASLGPWIRNTHWKDATLPDHELCLMGEGDLPLAEFHDVLRAGGYDGFYTLEWEKQWHPEIAEPEVAFPRYVEFMRGL